MNKLYLKNKLIKILSTRLLLVGVLLSLLIPQNAKSQARVYVNGGLEFGVPNAGLSQMDTNFGWAANGNFDAGAAISNPWYTSHPTQASVCSAGGSGACHPVEVWGTNFNGGQGATPSAQGTNFVELNAYVSSMIYQNLYLVTGDVITYYYRHRARSSTTERAGMVIEDQNENVIAIVHQTTLPSSSSAWSINQGTYTYT